MPRTFGALPRVFSLSARALGLETHCEEGGASAPIRIKPLYFEGIGTLDPEGNAAVKALIKSLSRPSVSDSVLASPSSREAPVCDALFD